MRESKRFKIAANCYTCQKSLIVRGVGLDQLRRSGRVYCSPDCAKAYRNSVSSATIIVTNKKYASARMKANNPMHRDDIREKMRQTLIDLGIRPLVLGGNGRGPTVAQSMLASKLPGWSMEFVITTGFNKAGYPRHYKIDIANEKSKIAIEVDGGSHNSPKARLRDQRKDTLLKELGWKVVRFRNQEVMNNLDRCLKELAHRFDGGQAPGEGA